jgi:hypothetical protein
VVDSTGEAGGDRGAEQPPVHTAVTRMSTTSRLIRCFMNGNGGDRTIRVTALGMAARRVMIIVLHTIGRNSGCLF